MRSVITHLRWALSSRFPAGRVVLPPACHTEHWPDCTLQREAPILPYRLKMASSNKTGVLRVRAVQTVACPSVDYPWEMTFSYGDSGEHSVCNTQK